MRAFWVWLTICLAWVKAQPPPNENDPDVLHLPSSLLDDAARKRILKTCDDPLARSVDQDPMAVWEGLGCFELHGILDYDWYSNQSNTRLSYVEYVSNKIHGPPNWRCYQVDNDECNDASVQCDDTAFVCGHMILNSFANVHSMYHRAWQAIKSAHDDVQDKVLSFTDIFAPEVKVFDILGDILIPIITVGIGVVGEASSKILDSVLDHYKQIEKLNREKRKGKQPATGTDDAGQSGQTGGAGDDKEQAALDAKYNATKGRIVNGVVSAAGMGMPYGLIHLPAQLTGESTDAKVFALLGEVYQILRSNQERQVEWLFNGSTTSMQALWRMVDSGTFMFFDGKKSMIDYYEEVKKMFFAALIPVVWEVAPGYEDDPENKKYHSTPMFLKTGGKCGDKAPSEFKNKYYQNNRDFDEICYEGDQWFMVTVEAWSSGGSVNPISHISQPARWNFKIRKLPGTDVLVGENGFQGVTAKDMLISALGAYKRSGTQFWSPNGLSVVNKDGSNYALQFTEGLHTPGLVQMQVCDDFQKMQEVLDKTVEHGYVVTNVQKREFPCGLVGKV